MCKAIKISQRDSVTKKYDCWAKELFLWQQTDSITWSLKMLIFYICVLLIDFKYFVFLHACHFEPPESASIRQYMFHHFTHTNGFCNANASEHGLPSTGDDAVRASCNIICCIRTEEHSACCGAEIIYFRLRLQLCPLFRLRLPLQLLPLPLN